jgi:hypothetical protein
MLATTEREIGLMDSRTYRPVTRSEADQFLKEVKENGLTLNGDNTSGTVQAYGCTVSYSFNAGQENLTLAIVSKPFLIPSSVIWGQVEQRIPSGITRA